jgi:hypothetical protein
MCLEQGMKTSIKPNTAPRQKVCVNFVTVQEKAAEMDRKRQESLQRVMDINARDRALKAPKSPPKPALPPIRRPASKPAQKTGNKFELEFHRTGRIALYGVWAPERGGQTGREADADNSKYYDGAELKPYIGRPGAQHAQTLPSRTGTRLRYLDGRVTDLAGNPITRSES